jgi:uncharacterized membrane protein
MAKFETTTLAALMTTLIAWPGYAAFTVCNRTGHAAKVALGYFDGKAWSSKGWWMLPRDGCLRLVSGQLDARYYYLYATDGDLGSWTGRSGFCVAANDAFSIKGRAHCEKRGYDRKGFFEIDTGEAKNYIQILSD